MGEREHRCYVCGKIEYVSRNSSNRKTFKTVPCIYVCDQTCWDTLKYKRGTMEGVRLFDGPNVLRNGRKSKESEEDDK